jgi:hypothetical protein
MYKATEIRFIDHPEYVENDLGAVLMETYSSYFVLLQYIQTYSSHQINISTG